MGRSMKLSKGKGEGGGVGNTSRPSAQQSFPIPWKGEGGRVKIEAGRDVLPRHLDSMRD